MIVQFIIACRLSATQNIKDELTSSLHEALESNQFEFDENDIAEMIELQYKRMGLRFVGRGDIATQHAVIGFSLELPEGTAFEEILIEDFIQELSASDVSEWGFVLLAEEILLLSTL